MSTPKEPGFEATIAELEALVARMESGDLPLDEALRSFERGVQLTRECQAALQAAQQRVQILTQRPGGLGVEEFSGDSAVDDASNEP
ncbi:MAG TPA: exodeoxyribonuclease VII small subunit [Steroidobacteraceae bacterium]|nr:exodeoxyribonuclease VII small subunit [Steroidobacteraceae bacterium]